MSGHDMSGHDMHGATPAASGHAQHGGPAPAAGASGPQCGAGNGMQCMAGGGGKCCCGDKPAAGEHAGHAGMAMDHVCCDHKEGK